MANKNEFATKIGLLAATVGSAIGLGNVWRFPAETQANGGAAFLLLYAVCVLLLGVPVMLSEFALGRGGRSDSIGVFRKLSPNSSWWIIGLLAIIASYIITSYYMVVAGWTLEYLWHSITGGLYDSGATSTVFSAKMQQCVYSDWEPVIATLVVIALNVAILLGGVQKGIERLSNILMPTLFVILIVLCVVALSLPGAADGLTYFLSPDFSKISPSVVVSAMGQAFFSLSLGMGILVTYASYYPDNTRLTRTSMTVALLSLLVALLMGCIIFPAVTTYGLNAHSVQGPTLIFVTLPEVFAHMPASELWSSLFFVLLLVAAITSTVSIAEVTIAFMQHHFKLSRAKAVLLTLLPLLFLSPICSLSFGRLSDLKFFGMIIFDFLDTITTSLLLPLIALGTCIYIGWVAPDKLFLRQMCNNGSIRSRVAPLVLFIIKYLAPVFIIVMLITGLI